MASLLPAGDTCMDWPCEGLGYCICWKRSNQPSEPSCDSVAMQTNVEHISSFAGHSSTSSTGMDPATFTGAHSFTHLSIDIPPSSTPLYPSHSPFPPPIHSSYAHSSPLQQFHASQEYLNVNPDYIQSIIYPSSAYSPSSSTASSASTPASSSTLSDPPSPMTPESELSVVSPCGLADTPASVLVQCPFCMPGSANYYVGPSDTVSCLFGQHLVQAHGMPASSRLAAEWTCIWPGCKCQGQGRTKLRRCDQYGRNHSAHVADPWHHLSTVHFGFVWRCNCGKERSSKNSLNNHIRPRAKSDSGVKRKPRQRRVRSTSDLNPDDVQQANEYLVPIHIHGPDYAGPQLHPQQYIPSQGHSAFQ